MLRSCSSGYRGHETCPCMGRGANTHHAIQQAVLALHLAMDAGRDAAQRAHPLAQRRNAAVILCLERLQIHMGVILAAWCIRGRVFAHR